MREGVRKLCSPRSGSMTDHSPVARTLSSLYAPPDQADVALVIRHAEREQIPLGTFGFDVPLTAHGVASAFQLGKALCAGRRVGVVSSPVPRCVQTAEVILRGCGHSSRVMLDRRLGDPGPFVVDSDLVGPLFLETDTLEIVRRQLSESEPLPGMRPTDEGVGALLDLVADSLESYGRLNVYVTHDSILAVLVARLFGMSIDEVGWPGYLDGLLLWKSSQRLQAVWREVRQCSDPLCG